MGNDYDSRKWNEVFDCVVVRSLGSFGPDEPLLFVTLPFKRGNQAIVDHC
jgi:hypothetical protein|tara:strand:+ start:527 stop:676 length:150 start_codon:yes stop_codon:yes gene_type:complete